MSRWILLIGTMFAVLGCEQGEEPLVVYTSVDSQYARPILEQFEADTGIAVEPVFDTEASKSVGLAERLRAERDRPRADVWWGNEVFYTVGLAEEGLLRPMDVPSDVPGQYVGADDLWVGNGLRARVIAAGTGVDVAGIDALTDSSFRDRITMARPTAGTTGGHVAALYVLWGEEKADQFFRDLHANGVVLVGGNAPSAEQVAVGNFDLGLTDNDDIAAVQAAGLGELTMIVPDQQPGGIGTLTIPTTVALVAGTTDPRAQQLATYLAGPDVEQALIDANFARFSIRTGDAGIVPMAVDYAEVARQLRPSIRRATALLEGREPPTVDAE
jgi:iron(III) transport system substrate-binding protein